MAFIGELQTTCYSMTKYPWVKTKKSNKIFPPDKAVNLSKKTKYLLLSKCTCIYHVYVLHKQLLPFDMTHFLRSFSLAASTCLIQRFWKRWSSIASARFLNSAMSIIQALDAASSIERKTPRTGSCSVWFHFGSVWADWLVIEWFYANQSQKLLNAPESIYTDKIRVENSVTCNITHVNNEEISNLTCLSNNRYWKIKRQGESLSVGQGNWSVGVTVIIILWWHLILWSHSVHTTPMSTMTERSLLLLHHQVIVVFENK